MAEKPVGLDIDENTSPETEVTLGELLKDFAERIMHAKTITVETEQGKFTFNSALALGNIHAVKLHRISGYHTIWIQAKGRKLVRQFTIDIGPEGGFTWNPSFQKQKHSEETLRAAFRAMENPEAHNERVDNQIARWLAKFTNKSTEVIAATS